jgi:type I restriction enzyme S subunit
MSKIDDLIREFCPEGIPNPPLAEVADLIRGTSISRDETEEGTVPVIAGGQKPAYWHHEANRNEAIVVIAGSGAYSGFVSFWDQPIWVSDAFSISGHPDKLLTKYCFYFLQNRQPLLYSFQRGSGVPHVYAKDVAKMRIPTPPIKLQREIVSILDKFTQLEAELKAELETRQRQFAEYSDQLLSDLGLDNASVPFGDVATIKRGASPRPISKFVSNGEGAVPWIKIGDVSQGSKFITKTKERVSQEGAAKSRVIQPGDFLLSNSMSFGRPYISKISGCIHDGWLSISEFEEHLDSDFLFHILNSTRIQTEFRRRAGSGTVKNLNAEIVKNVSLPLPPLSLQREIARALDTFEKFTSDSSDGLPAEISARRKQYEYYRNKLLTFKELDAA